MSIKTQESHTKTCTRCQREFEDVRPFAQICPDCKLPPGPKNHLAIDMNAPRRKRSRLFMAEGS